MNILNLIKSWFHKNKVQSDVTLNTYSALCNIISSLKNSNIREYMKKDILPTFYHNSKGYHVYINGVDCTFYYKEFDNYLGGFLPQFNESLRASTYAEELTPSDIPDKTYLFTFTTPYSEQYKFNDKAEDQLKFTIRVGSNGVVTLDSTIKPETIKSILDIINEQVIKAEKYIEALKVIQDTSSTHINAIFYEPYSWNTRKRTITEDTLKRGKELEEYLGGK